MTTHPAYAEGQAAFWAGKAAVSNPYPVPGDRAAAWDQGWADARREWRKDGAVERVYGEPVG